MDAPDTAVEPLSPIDPSSVMGSAADAFRLPRADIVDLAEQARVFEALFNSPAPVEYLGRYTLLGKLGSGGMGTVVEAFDRTLDRRVALKVLHEDIGERQRLIREAQALAKLSHPNVVQIYEVGEAEERAFIAMELVEGGSLREWMRQQPRPGWRECVDVFVQAGQGLAAAHAQGLIHRDFKPDNVLLGRDGRARVADFGLARPVELASDARVGQTMEDGANEHITASREPTKLTVTGSVVGTIAYMAPEQMRGRELDARADQFSFCVALFEALYGERPFDAPTPMARLLALETALPEPAALADAPRWLHHVVVRGLAKHPDDRFPSMDALLRELMRPRGRMWTVGLAAGVLVLGGMGMYAVRPATEDPCAHADAELATQWTDQTRAEIRDAFVAAEPSYGADAAARVDTALDAHVQAWRAELRDVCEDTRVRGTHTEQLQSRRTACVERNTADLRALLGALPIADAAVVEHAVELVDGLPNPARCQDLDALGPETPDDPATVRTLRDGIARVRVMYQAGREADVRDEIDMLVERAKQTGYGPVHAEAFLEAARVRLVDQQPQDIERATEMLWQALDLAEAHGHDALRYPIWINLLNADRDRGEHDRARLWFRRAQVALAHHPNEPRLRGELALLRGVLELHAGELAASERWLRQGLSETGEARAEEGMELVRARLLDALGNTLRQAGRGTEARDAFEQARVEWAAGLGPDHPSLAWHDYNLGLLLVDLGEHSAAREHLIHAHEIWTTLYGPEALLVGRAELGLANLDQATGALDDALAHARRGQEISKHLPATEPFRTETLQTLGLVQFRRGDLEAASDAWQRALERLVAGRGADDPEVLLTRSNLAEAWLGQGRYEEALSLYEALRSDLEARTEPDPLTQMLVLKGLGLATLELGRPAQALSPLTAALEHLDALGGLPLERADLLWALARAERGAGGSEPILRQHAARSAALYAEHGRTERADEIHAWLNAAKPD